MFGSSVRLSLDAAFMGHVVHHFNGTELRCAPPTCVVPHQPGEHDDLSCSLTATT